MKIILFSIFFNLFVFLATHSPLSAASDIVYDSGGNQLLRGIPYYILPLLRGSGGGLTVSQDTKNACPLNVTQEPFEVNQGIPFTFNPIVLDEQFIRASYPTSIEADVTNPCSQSNIWKILAESTPKSDKHQRLTDSNDDKKKREEEEAAAAAAAAAKLVTTGGEFNSPESCFQLVEDDIMPGLQSYQIQHCPFKCGSSGTSSLTCYNVGITSDADGKNYLSHSDVLFPVVFASSIFKSTKSEKASILTTFSQ